MSTTTKEKTNGTLSFYTTGEGFTNLMRTFIEEGRYNSVIESLLEGGLPPKMVKEFFQNKFRFEGDSRDEEKGLYTVSEETVETEEEFAIRMYWSFRNYLSGKKSTKGFYLKDDEEEYFPQLEMAEALSKKWISKQDDLKKFFKYVLSREELIKLTYRKLIIDEGYEVNPSPLKYNGDGIILDNGDFISIGSQQHHEAYSFLFRLGLVDSPDWMDEHTSFHLSSGQLSGGRVRNFQYGAEHTISAEQIKTLVKYKHSIKGQYSGYDKLFYDLLGYFNELYDGGGKWNNLMFLKQAYPHFNFPQIDSWIIPDKKNIVRTSPKHSLPGLLESKIYEGQETLDEMQKIFEQYKDVREGNEFYYFFQEFLEGKNGVAHQRRDHFSYAISSKQGDIVKGVESKEYLSLKLDTELRKIMEEMYKDFGKGIQVEFVVTPDDKIYIVQLRILQNEPEQTVLSGSPVGTLFQGLTFSRGEIENVSLNDVLVVESDAESKDLLGKKALIVRSNVEFSHILALSKALDIPSLYGVGPVELPPVFSIKAFNKEAFIYKK